MPYLHWTSYEDLKNSSHRSWLCSAELAQFEIFPSERRKRDWLAGRLAAKKALLHFAREHKYQLLQPTQWRIVSTGDGVPRVRWDGVERSDVSLSIAHSHGQGFAGVAHCPTEGRIGVDMERIRPLHPRLASRMLTPREQKALRTSPKHQQNERLILYWTLKEAALKALQPLAGALWMNRLEAQIHDDRKRARILFSFGPEQLTLQAQYREHDGFVSAWALLPPEQESLIGARRSFAHHCA